MKKLRVALFSYHTCPLASQEGKETGGMNVYVLELAKKLAEEGIAVDVFTRSQEPQNQKIVNVSAGFRVIHLKAGPQESVAKKLLLQFIPSFADSFIQFINQEKINYDLFYAHYYMSGMAVEHIQTKLLQKIPLIMTFHTLALMKNLVARTEGEQETQERIDAEYRLVKNSDHIITTSENDRSYLEYLYEADTTQFSVIPPGVDTHLFRPISKEIAKKHIGADINHKLLIFAGRIEPLKGIDSLLYAIKILTQKRPDLPVCLWVVGGDISQKLELWSHELKKLETLRHTLHIHNSVRFVGQQNQDELVYYYNAAEAVVMPSHYESFGMAVAEAMACGVPVITTNVSGISQYIDQKHQKLIASVNNPLLLATQIEHLLSDSRTHQVMSDEVHQKVQDLSWDKIATSVIKTFHKVIAETKK